MRQQRLLMGRHGEPLRCPGRRVCGTDMVGCAYGLNERVCDADTDVLACSADERVCGTDTDVHACGVDEQVWNPRRRVRSRGGHMRRAAAAGAAAMLLAAMAVALAACGGAGAKADGAAAGKEAAAGPLAQANEPVLTLYKASCQSCHGADLAGRAGPVTNLQHVGGRLSEEQIAAQITRGGGNMPGFSAKLKPDEIAALAAWLAAVK